MDGQTRSKVMEIKPCPFCKGEKPGIVDMAYLRVKCFDCGAEGPKTTDYDGAIRVWNRGSKEDETN